MFSYPGVFRMFLLAVLLSGCGQNEPAAIIDGSFEVTAAGTTFPNTEGERHWLQFATRAETESEGRIQPKMLIYGQLGSEEQILAGLRRGRVQFANVSAMSASTLVPESALLYAPFLFADEAEADFILDGYLTPVYRELLAAKGLHLLTWYEIGFLQVYGKEPILMPSDAAGRRFRVGAGLAARLFAESLNADVIPLGFTDVVAGLQTGLIEAGENAVSLYTRSGIAPEAPHLTLTDHSYGVSMIVVQKDWWDALAPADQQILGEAFPGISASRLDVRAESLSDLENARSLGITVHSLTPEQRAGWAEAAVDIRSELAAGIGGRSPEILELIDAGRVAYRQSQ
jgi:TRAP-type C4-dicarboxylate transport system substrate-binding protein